ncbi:hypothetical protein E1B28_004416 [Marasmius oreades]|uniref:HMG box domain-containing protein n=1 Tax=Marasmius oreades TaxID=181124 RepID=A0A9P7UYQ5_9AGAR|nr:uncharacterized protein E1B28_004416 [Marasmius oreades]KAG7097023.1 hypothetical protein E1B28_004416 [Marasmius oreades]
MENTVEFVDTSNSPSSSSSRSWTLPNISARNEAITNILFLDSVCVSKAFHSEGLGQTTALEVPQLPSLPPLSSTPSLSPAPEKQCQKHIPRPLNAFMLYRSDLLKKKQIPPNVERRQQALSSLAGQCWNMLAPEEKQKWQTKAAETYRLHQLKYPDYKFSPSPKGSGRKGKGKNTVSESAVRALREKYVHMPGPTVPPARRRRGKKAKKDALKDEQPSDVETPSEASITPSLSPVIAPLPPWPAPVYPFPHPGSNSGEGATLPPDFPSPSLPIYFADRRQMSTGPSSSMSSVDPYFTQLPASPLSVPLSVPRYDMTFQGYVTPSFYNDGYHYTESYGAVETDACTKNIDPLHCMMPFTTVDPNGISEQSFRYSLTTNETEMPSLIPMIPSSSDFGQQTYAFSSDNPAYLTYL